MTCCDWSTYSALKLRWIARNPDATPREYEAAMRRIATKLGL